MTLYEGNDHWAFLEQIEAPMWVDLTLEANTNNQDVDEEWFRTSHLIHQSSSIELRSGVIGEEDMVIDSGLDEPSSPKSTHSVSRSRGNEYKSKKWRDSGSKSFSKKQHLVKVGTEKLSKPSFSKSKSSSVSDTRAVHESSQQVPRLEIDKNTRFLEFLKSSLRNSYINNDGRESNGCKSSVGSSRMVKETTSDSKDVVRVKSKAKVANTSKTSTFQVDKSTKVEKTAKSKVIQNGRDTCAAAKGVTKVVKVGGGSGINRAEAAGKENARGVLWVQKDKTGTTRSKKAASAKPHFR